MNRQVKLGLSVVVIIAVGWLDMQLAGTRAVTSFSPVGRQLSHLTALAFTCFIGWLNCRSFVTERWPTMLWVASYSLVFALLFLVLLGSFFLPTPLKTILAAKVFMIRTLFISPLPLLTVYLLHQMVTRKS